MVQAYLFFPAIVAFQALPKSDLVLDVEIGGSASMDVVRQAVSFIGTEDLTHDIKRVSLKVDKPIHYKAGQYANITWGNGSIHRSYSFADAPSSGGTLEPGFFIRHVPGRSEERRVGKGGVSRCRTRGGHDKKK